MNTRAYRLKRDSAVEPKTTEITDNRVRNRPRAEDLWHGLPVGDAGIDIAIWEHNWTGQQIVILHDGSEYAVEARHGDLLKRVDDGYAEYDIAAAFAWGLMEGHIDGEVIGNV
jgi:hypothetical protein